MAFDQAKFWKNYYQRKKGVLKRKKRERYRTDPLYRQRMKDRARDAYAQKVRDSGGKVQSFGMPYHGSSVVKDESGRLFYSTAWAARFAGVTEQTIRRWIKEEKIPPPLQENKGGRRWRWFTPYQLVILRRFRGYVSKPHRVRRALTGYAFKFWEEEDEQNTVIEDTREAKGTG